MNELSFYFHQVGRCVGINPVSFWTTLRNLPRYCRDYRAFKRQAKMSGGEFRLGRLFPCLRDWSESCGAFESDYFHQDLLVARSIYKNNPQKHVDVGSRVDGFIAHVASFREIEVMDIRPLNSDIPNIVFKQADFMGSLPGELCNYCDSISCLHAMEHFGLGRYGDPICYDGYKKGIDNLLRMLKSGGKCYFSVPLGPQRIEFNAHRVFSARFLLDRFRQECIIDRVSFIDGGVLHEDVKLSTEAVDSNFGCEMGCIILEMTKR